MAQHPRAANATPSTLESTPLNTHPTALALNEGIERRTHKTPTVTRSAGGIPTWTLVMSHAPSSSGCGHCVTALYRYRLDERLASAGTADSSWLMVMSFAVLALRSV